MNKTLWLFGYLLIGVYLLPKTVNPAMEGVNSNRELRLL